MSLPATRAFRQLNTARDKLAELGLYHGMRLLDGQVVPGTLSVERLEARWARFGLPERLDGLRVLDVGPWDGFFSFEAARRGAQVTAVDLVDLDSFRVLRNALAPGVRYLQSSVYDLSPESVGQFDVTFFLGVLYHLRHPLLALEQLCSVTLDLCLVETFVVEPPGAGELPLMEFYERDELGGQLDNWFGPSVSAVPALLRSAGFAEAEILSRNEQTALYAARRQWTRLPPATAPGLHLKGLTNSLRRSRCFTSGQEEYISLFCDWEGGAPGLGAVYPEVDGRAVPPLSANLSSDGLVVNLFRPPGLALGAHRARLRIGSFDWSGELEFFVDRQAPADPEILSLQDGVTLRADEIDRAAGGWLTLWLRGLPAWAECGDVTVTIGDTPHHPDFLDAATGQLNVRLRPSVPDGLLQVGVAIRGRAGEERPVKIFGRSAGWADVAWSPRGSQRLE